VANVLRSRNLGAMKPSSCFGTFELIPERSALLCDGEAVHLGSRAFSLLRILVENAGKVVSGAELTAQIWPDTSVGEANLRVHLAAVRKVLSEGGCPDGCIVTVPGRGYQFAMPVTHRKTENYQKSWVNVPPLLAKLIGRDQVIQEILSDLADRRLISIVGSGGIGKTSVALATAGRAIEIYPDGVFFVDFTSLTVSSPLAFALASSLRLPASSGIDEMAVFDYLGPRETLIVFDNCEHVIEAAASFAEKVLRECPNVHLLATSREPLRTEGEFVKRLLPLQAPSLGDASLTAVEALAFPAVQLFVERASSGVAGFSLTDEDAPALALLCNKLDGIPLAIELAAARIDLFDIRTLTNQLEDCLELLTRNRRTAQERHRTLRATLDWSYGLLSDGEQLLLARLSVFRSEFDRDAALTVATDHAMTKGRIWESLPNLVAKSLLVMSNQGSTPVFRLLDSTRAYAIEKLGDGPGANSVRRLHAEYIRDKTLSLAPKNGFVVKSHQESHSKMVDELRAAIVWAFSAKGDPELGIEVIASSAYLWFQLSLFEEFKVHADRALEAMSGTPNVSKAELRLLLARGPALYETLGAVPELFSTATRALELAKQLDDRLGISGALHNLWRYHHGLGEYSRSLDVALQIEEYVGGDSQHVWWNPLKALSLLYLGNLKECRSVLSEIEDQVTISDDGIRGAYDYNLAVLVKGTLARVLWLQGFPEDAIRVAEESVAAALERKQSVAICFALSIAGCPINIWNRNLKDAERNLSLLQEHARLSNSLYWKQYVDVFRLGVAAANGQPADRQFKAGRQQSYWDYRHWENFSVLGLGFAPVLLVQRAKSDPSWWCAPEVLRLEAVRMHGEGKSQARADVCLLLQQSLEIAQRQQALSWELRTATTLLELAQTGEEITQAKRLLKETMSDFAGGFDSYDFRRAEALLEKSPRFAGASL
jgi:predicted ATPase/DNA-binding winged helix-turn-helix (wHTH) protein